MTRIRSTIGAVLRRWGNSLDPDGAFQDEVAAEVRRRRARDAALKRITAGSVTCGGDGGGITLIAGRGGSGASVSIDPLLFDPRGGGDGGPMHHVGSATVTGPA